MIGTVCLLVAACTLINAEEFVVDSQYKCDHEFSMDDGQSVDIRYNGAALETDSCEIKFTLDGVSDYKICVQPIELNLDCDTDVEYQNHFVANSINDGLLECSMNNQLSYDETCKDYVSTFFLVIKKQDPYSSTNENFKINVVASEKENYDIGEVNNFWWISLLSIIPGIVICTSVVVCRLRFLRRQREGTNVHANYNTGCGVSSVQTGGNPYATTQFQQTGNQQPINSGNQYSGQQPAGGFIHHPPVSSAYPTQNQPAFGFNYNQQAPSAPPGSSAAPPPSYDSLTTK